VKNMRNIIVLQLFWTITNYFEQVTSAFLKLRSGGTGFKQQKYNYNTILYFI